MSDLDKPGSSPITQKQGDEHLSGQEGMTTLSNALAATPGVSFPDFARSPKGQEFLETKKIVIAGAPQSGKSVLRELLKRSIRAIPNAPYPYFLTAAPDGEWAGFQESVRTDPDLARKMKTDYKTAIKEGGSMFTPEYVTRISDSVKNLSAPHSPLNFLDIGGKMTLENRGICEGANAAIILCGERAAKVAGGVGSTEDQAQPEMNPREWKEFFSGLGIPVIGVIYSDYTGKEDAIGGIDKTGAFVGSSHYFERGELDIESRPAIRAFAEYLVKGGVEREMRRQMLVEKLHTAGVDLSTWGYGATKTVEQLFQEIEGGEAELVTASDGRLVRKTAVANIEVQYTDAAKKRWRLIERKQVFADGSERERGLGTSVAEKLKVGENVPEAAVRGLQEELGFSEMVALSGTGVELKEADSPSYPGLRAQYEIHAFTAELSPEQYKPEGYIEAQPDKSTYFEWEEVTS